MLFPIKEDGAVTLRTALANDWTAVQWQFILHLLPERAKAGKPPLDRRWVINAVIDRQSIRTAEGGECRSYDAGKKIAGRQRHITVDTLGLIWAVVEHVAHWQDQEGAHFVIHALRRLTRLWVVFGNSDYSCEGLPEWTRQSIGWIFQTDLRPVAARGFVVLPKR